MKEFNNSSLCSIKVLLGIKDSITYFSYIIGMSKKSKFLLLKKSFFNGMRTSIFLVFKKKKKKKKLFKYSERHYF